jgi:hypothetical protein
VKKKQNAGFDEKQRLRRIVLGGWQPSRVIETHGGEGRIHRAFYASAEEGCAFEVREDLAARMAAARPSWFVYCAKAEAALAAGAGASLPVEVIDLDPYGQPWPALEAFFTSEREFADELRVVVNDGLRLKLRLGSPPPSMAAAAERWGAHALNRDYLAVARWNLERLAGMAGYEVARFTGFHGGFGQQMTHYGAVLTRTGGTR